MQEETNAKKTDGDLRMPQMDVKVRFDFQQPVSKFFFYQNTLVCQCEQNILILNAVTKERQSLAVPKQEYILVQLPPFLFAIMEDRYIHAYRLCQDKLLDPMNFRISKLEPKAICRFNKGYFLGGFNRSMLPGNKRTTTRDIYFIQNLDSKQKNRPEATIRLKDSQNPVSVLQVQNPYLLAYCQPIAYLISILSRQILITFQKDAANMLLLEGRFATSSVNGVGVSKKHTLFTFDVQRLPIFGVEITQHRHECQMVCMERTGRIFGARGNEVFEYHPFRQEVGRIVRYNEGEQVKWISCTPSNSLMVLRCRPNSWSCLQVFTLE